MTEALEAASTLTKLEMMVAGLLMGSANYYGTDDDIQMIVARAVKIATEALAACDRSEVSLRAVEALAAEQPLSP